MADVLKAVFGNSDNIAVTFSLVTLAGSVVAYVIKLFLDLADRRRSHFLELMKLLDGDGPIAGKMAAVHELSQYKRKKEFLIRFFGARQILLSDSGTGPVLKKEMQIAEERLRAL